MYDCPRGFAAIFLTRSQLASEKQDCYSFRAVGFSYGRAVAKIVCISYFLRKEGKGDMTL